MFYTRIGFHGECLLDEMYGSSAQRRRSQPALIMIMIIKLVSVCVDLVGDIIGIGQFADDDLD